MQNLLDLTNRLASLVVQADANDLTLLADMHSQFQNLAQQSQVQRPELAPIGQLAAEAEKVLEAIILQEIKDIGKALQKVSQSVSDIQKLLKKEPGKAPVSSAAIPPPPLATPTAAAPPEASHPAIEAESPIKEDDAPMIAEFIGEAGTHLESAEANLLKVEENPGDMEAINAIFRGFHTIKGVAGFLNLRQIGALAHAAESLLDLARKGELILSGSIVDVVLESSDTMKSLIAQLSVASKTLSVPPTAPALPNLLERLRAAAAAAAGLPVAAPVAAPAPVAAATAAAAPAQEINVTAAPAKAPEVKATAAGNEAKAAAAAAPAAEATVKVATDRLDNLINMVGELVIAQSMVAQDMSTTASENQRLGRNMAHLGKITRELQDLSMSMRMVPIQGVFQKMTRLVRDLAKKSSKDVELVVVGGETELDRNLVEAISDPLVHMVRNSADHGIEPPEVREKAGKPRSGTVTLKAFHQAGHIVIEITDDGRGLNKAKILQKAIANGIIKEGQELSEQEIFKLIFHAGLSTAEKVTDISGRGVGMDVVRKNVEALRGRIDIASVEGKGSTFSIRLPLTLAVIDGLVVKVGRQRYIIPITNIEQSIQPKASQLSTVQNRGEMCMLRGHLLPVYRLYKIFNLDPKSTDPTQALVVILHDNQRRCALLVDELLGQQQVVIKSLGYTIGQVGGISGGAILGDGTVSLILDVPGLMDIAGRS